MPSERAIISTRIATATMIQITIMIFFCKPTHTHINTNVSHATANPVLVS